jgi:hypothetical protein
MHTTLTYLHFNTWHMLCPTHTSVDLEIVAASVDETLLVCTDSAMQNPGFVDITPPLTPCWQALLPMVARQAPRPWLVQRRCLPWSAAHAGTGHAPPDGV